MVRVLNKLMNYKLMNFSMFCFALNPCFICDRVEHIKGGSDLNANKLKSNIMEILKVFQWL